MKREKNERLKTIILVTLITISLVQSGILWSFMQHGFPFDLLSTILSISTPVLNDKVIREKFFKPIRIVASEGNYPGAHWIIEDSDTYDKLWKETMLLVKAALKSKPENILDSEHRKWSEIVKKKSFVYEFNESFNTKLFAWFLDIAETSSTDLISISKIAVLPDEDLNNNMAVYITDNIRTLKFVIPPSQISRSKYNEMLAKLSGNSNLVKYNIISELFNGAASIREDILLVWGAAKNFNTAQSMLPERIKVGNSKELSARNILAETILDNAHSYDSDIDKYGGIVYVNENNIYRIYEDGYFVYLYRNNASETSKSNIIDSFRSTIEYINTFCEKFDIPTDKLYLINVVEEKDYYRFSFNYVLDGIPVLVEHTPKGQENALDGAVVIEANNKRVTSCKWLVRDISVTKNVVSYNISFQLLANEVAKKGISLFRPSSPFVEDIFEAYVVSADSDIETDVKPAWIVKMKDREKIIIPMSSDGENK